MSVTVNCQQCSKKLVRFPSHVKGQKFGSFCNQKCLGLFRTEKLTGDWAANYQNGFKKDRKYIKVHANWHPSLDKTGYVYLHRLIIEARLGRYLNGDEIVHHKDGNPLNNHWDNLEVMSQAEHAAEHMKNRSKNENS